MLGLPGAEGFDGVGVLLFVDLGVVVGAEKDEVGVAVELLGSEIEGLAARAALAMRDDVGGLAEGSGFVLVRSGDVQPPPAVGMAAHTRGASP